jgi:DNA-binding MarR family transcriptional regulator
MTYTWFPRKQVYACCNRIREELMDVVKEELFFKNMQLMNDRKSLLNRVTKKMKYQISEVHCIELIGKMKDANVTRLAEAFYMTKGAISKIIKKLLRYGAIESYQKSENKQKIFYKLTPLGNDINKDHEELLKKLIERDRSVFQQLNEQEKDSVIKFLEIYNAHLESELQKTCETVEIR